MPMPSFGATPISVRPIFNAWIEVAGIPAMNASMPRLKSRLS